MTSSPSPFANGGKLQVLPTPVSNSNLCLSLYSIIQYFQTTLLFTQQMNNNMGNATQYIRQASTQNGTILQQPITSGIMTTPSTSIVRVNQPQTIQHQQQSGQNQGQYVQQTVWSNNLSQNPQQQQQQFTLQKQTQPSSVLQYATIKNGKKKIFITTKKSLI